MSAPRLPARVRREGTRAAFPSALPTALPIAGIVFVVLTVLIVGAAFVAQRVQFYASEQLSYREEFLTPDLDRYPMQRKGTSPESIQWAPDGIVFDPPTGMSAYVELDAYTLIREPSRLAAFTWRLIGNRRPPPVGLLQIEVVVERRGGYVTIVDWGDIVVQDTTQGVMVTVIDSQSVHTNYYFSSLIDHMLLLITFQHEKEYSCIIIQQTIKCISPNIHAKRSIKIGESRIDQEHNGMIILRRIMYV